MRKYLLEHEVKELGRRLDMEIEFRREANASIQRYAERAWARIHALARYLKVEFKEVEPVKPRVEAVKKKAT